MKTLLAKVKVQEVTELTKYHQNVLYAPFRHVPRYVNAIFHVCLISE